PVALPDPADRLARKGMAGPIACPAADQCWMATQLGWLFHLGGPVAADTDPVMHRLITVRPPGNGLPALPPDSLAIDDSGAYLPPEVDPPLEEADPVDAGPVRRAPKLVIKVARPRVLRGTTTLVLSFTLRAKARVQLIAKRRGRVVAKTRRQILRAGRRSLR